MAVEIRRDLLNLHTQLHLRLVHAASGTYPCHSEKSFLPVNRLLMIFADSGQDDSYIHDLANGVLHPMRRGNIYFVPCRYEINQHQTEDLEFVSFQFNLDLFPGFDLMSRFPECRVFDRPDIVDEARNLIRSHDEPFALCRINEIIYSLCSNCLREKPELFKNDMKYRSDWQTILDYVEKECTALLTVGALAEMKKMRQDVFSRKFTREMGIPPKDLIHRILFRKSSVLLGNYSLTVREIAEKLHFSSEFYFSRFFKHQSGMSPTEYRRFYENGK